MSAINRLLTTFILFCCSSIFTSSIKVGASHFDYLGGLDGIPDVVSKLYAVELQFKFCIACWQMIGDPGAAMDEPLRLWLGDTGDWRGGGPDDEYTEYVVAYVRDAVELLMGSSYDGATIPRVLRRPECNRLVLENISSFLERPPKGTPEIPLQDRERVLQHLEEKLPENEASFNCNWIFDTLGE